MVPIDLSLAVASLDGDVDATNRLRHTWATAAPEVQDRIHGLVYLLAGSPTTGDLDWGRSHAFDGSAVAAFRLCVALHVVGLLKAEKVDLEFLCNFEDRFARDDSSRSRVVDVVDVWLREHTQAPPPEGAIGFINGINVSFGNAIDVDHPQFARCFSSSGADFVRAALVYNGDKKLLQFAEVAAGHHALCTLPTLLVLHELFAFFARRTRGRYLLVAFSGGATHAAVALAALPASLQARVAVLAVGPSFFLDPALACQVAHVAKINDWVPAHAKNASSRWCGGRPPAEASRAQHNVVVAVEHVTRDRDPHDPHVPEMVDAMRAFALAFWRSGGTTIF